MKLRKFYVLVGFVIVVGLAACSGDETEAPELTLRANPEEINEGESSTLSWDVSGSEPMTLTLEPSLPADVALTSPLEVSPTETTTYTLTATNSAGSDSREVIIEVNKLPEVMSFEVSSESIVQGRSITVSWQTDSDDPITATLTPSDTPDAPVTSPLTLSPTETTTYTLTLTNSAGSTSRKFTVAVTPPAAPTITSLTSTPTAGNGLEVTLNWQLSSASACSIDPGDGSPALSFEDCMTTTEVAHTYSEAGTYTVIFSLPTGATQTLRLTVSSTDSPSNSPPTVNAGDDIDVVLGDDVTLTGQANDPDGDALLLAWELTDKPFTSTFEFFLGGNTDTLTATFQLDVPGVYSFRLTARDGNSVVSDDVSITVVDNSPRNSVYFVPDNMATNLVEGQLRVVELERTGSTAAPLTVSLRVAASSTATADDYSVTDASLEGNVYQVSFEERRSRTRLTLTATEDNLDEGTETVFMTLLASDDYDVIEPSQVTLNIVDDAPEPGEPEPPILRSCQGGIIVRYQEDIDALFACRTVLGTLIIDPGATLPFNDTEDVPAGSPITSLVPLRYLETVTSAFRIKNIPTLSSLGGLERLSSTRDIFELTNLDGLTSLNGLNNLETGGSFIVITENDNLSNLEGLQSLEKVDGSLNIRTNASLTTLTGLESLRSVGGFGLSITNNPQLTSVIALANLESVDSRVTIWGNNRLESLAGLENLNSIGGLHIVSNELLTSLTNINRLEFVGFSGIHILNNPRLSSLGTFEQLTSVEGDVLLAANDSLSSLKSFENITRIAGVLGIGDASSYYGDFGTGASDGGSDKGSGDSDVDMHGTEFSSLTELTSLTSVGGLHISDNPQLSSLAGLEKLTALSLDLRIKNNAVLASLMPLANINSPVQSLVIDNNNALTELTGLEGITGISEDFDASLIQHNDALVSLAAITNLTDEDIAGYIAINDNSSLDCAAQNLQFTPDASAGNLLDCVSIEGLQPTINAFTATPESLTSGQTAILNWDVTGATPMTVTISPDIGEVEPAGSITLAPSSVTSYTLTAVNDIGTATSQVTITVSNSTPKLCDEPGFVETQAQVDALAGCTEVANLTISEVEPGAISSLAPLSDLTYVAGRLTISRISGALESLTGLDNLTAVGGSLYIFDNISLTSLQGLDNLREVGYELVIEQNAALVSLAGLGNLTVIGNNAPPPSVENPSMGVYIASNPSLTSLAGLDNLEVIESWLMVHRNDALTSVAGMPKLVRVEGLSFSRNEQLTSLAGLEAIRNFGGLSVSYNPRLESLFEPTATAVGNRLNVRFNDVLTSLAGLEDITWNNLQITDNPALTSVNLSNLATPMANVFIERNPALTAVVLNSSAATRTSTFWITDNPALTSLAFPRLTTTFEIALDSTPLTTLDLTGLTAVEHNLYVIRTALTTLEGLSSLEMVQGDVDISFNEALSSLTGVDKLSEVGRSLRIGFNSELTSLAGLGNITNYNNDNFVSISSNPKLDCTPPPVLSFIVDTSTGNLVNCPTN